MPAPAELVAEKAAAAVLGVSVKTLQRWRRAGLIAHFATPGGRIRYAWADLVEAATWRRVEPAERP